jgi:hypothetical protein
MRSAVASDTTALIDCENSAYCVPMYSCALPPGPPVAQDPEGDDDDPHGRVVAEQAGHEPRVPVHVVGVEVHAGHALGTGRAEGGVDLVHRAGAGGQHDLARARPHQFPRQRRADLAAPAQDDHRTRHWTSLPGAAPVRSARCPRMPDGRRACG